MEHNRKNGVTLVSTVFLLFVLLGFAALTVDVGVMFNTRGDLQIVADAASLAAASELSSYEHGEDVEYLAMETARKITLKNNVLGHKRGTFVLEDDDFEFLNAYYVVDQEHADYLGFTTSGDEIYPCYLFTPSSSFPDAVRVTARKTDQHQNGPLELFFASIFGINNTNVQASATAVLVPRDIALVADLSASHTDDSELRNYKTTKINLYEVWDSLPGGISEPHSKWGNPESLPNGWAEQAAGPGWGYMLELGYGTLDWEVGGLHDGNSYDPNSDSGLVRLPYNVSWTNQELELNLLSQGYNQEEVDAILSSNYDSNGAYKYRVAVAMGLAFWNSGKSGGLWEQRGINASDSGNGNSWIGGNELEWVEQITSKSMSTSSNMWLDYIDNYVKNSTTTMYSANSGFRYSYGIKTFVNYLMDRRPQNNQIPELSDTPTQPMQSVKDAVCFMVDFIGNMKTNDQLSLEIYGRTAHHEIDLTRDYINISSRLAEMQAGHYDTWTNIGGGIKKGIAELESIRARSFSRKIIILLTDGIANTNSEGNYDTQGAIDFAIEQTEIAASKGIKIFAISVGSGADQSLMNQIAQTSNGTHFHAAGNIQDYETELASIFQTLCTTRDYQIVE